MDWKRKLGSRKFWALAAGVATSVLVLVGAGEDAAVKITGVISAVGTVVVYILAEAHVDAANKGSDKDAE
jgi:siroheme synthase (precorrin-2 oxidase/ferrochelatase)